MIREPSAASLYTAIPFHQDASVLIIGERTNANGSKAFREAMLGEDWQKCLDTAKGRPATELTCSNSASTVGRDCVADMNA